MSVRASTMPAMQISIHSDHRHTHPIEQARAMDLGLSAQLRRDLEQWDLVGGAPQAHAADDELRLPGFRFTGAGPGLLLKPINPCVGGVQAKKYGSFAISVIL